MNLSEELNKHKIIIELLINVLPFAIPRYKKKYFFIKKENELNSLISEFIGKHYLLDLSENKKQFLHNDLYEEICNAYEYILNIVDNTSEKYNADKINIIKEKLGIE